MVVPSCMVSGAKHDRTLSTYSRLNDMTWSNSGNGKIVGRSLSCYAMLCFALYGEGAGGVVWRLLCDGR